MLWEATETAQESGLLGFALHSDGAGYDKLKLPYVSQFQRLKNTAETPADQGSYGKILMDGPEVSSILCSLFLFSRCLCPSLSVSVSISLCLSLSHSMY